MQKLLFSTRPQTIIQKRLFSTNQPAIAQKQRISQSTLYDLKYGSLMSAAIGGVFGLIFAPESNRNYKRPFLTSIGLGMIVGATWPVSIPMLAASDYFFQKDK